VDVGEAHQHDGDGDDQQARHAAREAAVRASLGAAAETSQ